MTPLVEPTAQGIDVTCPECGWLSPVLLTWAFEGEDIPAAWVEAVAPEARCRVPVTCGRCGTELSPVTVSPSTAGATL